MWLFTWKHYKFTWTKIRTYSKYFSALLGFLSLKFLLASWEREREFLEESKKLVSVSLKTYIVVPVSRRLVRRPGVLQRLPHITVLLFVLDRENDICMNSHITHCKTITVGPNGAKPALTLTWCFWMGPFEGELLLPCEAAFATPCLLLCYK